ncbi:MAG TPA: DNA damage-inducible protein D [Ktedonobacteraceae bacterium]|nr:DNA damage-inducible protein D [Ktedonobacteraceae bacterium]
MDNEEDSTIPDISPFESIRKVNEDGFEYWSARDLAKILGYTEFRKFNNAIQKAEAACENSGQQVADHFAHLGGMVNIGSGAKRKVEDVHLSRYACYLLIQNSDPSKEIVALGQTYFAVQTRRQERADELAALSEDQRRLYLRGQLTDHNRQLAEAASHAGVVKPLDFAIFQDHGYMGLYGGLRTKDIHSRKGLKKSQQILDHMGSTELAANLFRATQTEDKIRREGIRTKEKANRTHFEVGKKVRQTIEELGGTMPENLPTPKESIQQIQQKEQKRLKQAPQLSIFDEPLETDS